MAARNLQSAKSREPVQTKTPQDVGRRTHLLPAKAPDESIRVAGLLMDSNIGPGEKTKAASIDDDKNYIER